MVQILEKQWNLIVSKRDLRQLLTGFESNNTKLSEIHETPTFISKYYFNI